MPLVPSHKGETHFHLPPWYTVFLLFWPKAPPPALGENGRAGGAGHGWGTFCRTHGDLQLCTKLFQCPWCPLAALTQRGNPLPPSPLVHCFFTVLAQSAPAGAVLAKMAKKWPPPALGENGSVLLPLNRLCYYKMCYCCIIIYSTTAMFLQRFGVAVLVFHKG